MVHNQLMYLVFSLAILDGTHDIRALQNLLKIPPQGGLGPVPARVLPDPFHSLSMITSICT
jgi:hypothetical protein